MVNTLLLGTDGLETVPKILSASPTNHHKKAREYSSSSRDSAKGLPVS